MSYAFFQEFEESGDPEKHFQALLTLAKEGIEKGKVGFIVLIRHFKYRTSAGDIYIYIYIYRLEMSDLVCCLSVFFMKV